MDRQPAGAGRAGMPAALVHPGIDLGDPCQAFTEPPDWSDRRADRIRREVQKDRGPRSEPPTRTPSAVDPLPFELKEDPAGPS